MSDTTVRWHIRAIMELINRDGEACVTCNGSLNQGEKDEPVPIFIHHITPLAYGGEHDMNNLCLMHSHCSRHIRKQFEREAQRNGISRQCVSCKTPLGVARSHGQCIGCVDKHPSIQTIAGNIPKGLFRGKPGRPKNSLGKRRTGFVYDILRSRGNSDLSFGELMKAGESENIMERKKKVEDNKKREDAMWEAIDRTKELHASGASEGEGEVGEEPDDKQE